MATANTRAIPQCSSDELGHDVARIEEFNRRFQETHAHHPLDNYATRVQRGFSIPSNSADPFND
jgi:hypothetical protein